MVKSEKTFRNQAENSMFVWVAMTVVMVGGITGDTGGTPSPGRHRHLFCAVFPFLND
jgi:hypothetical protein